MRKCLPVCVLLAFATPALAQVPSPLSGPNDSIPSPVCDVINFGFCPQPPAPPPILPDVDAEAAAARRPAPLPMHHPMHHKMMHRHHRPKG